MFTIANTDHRWFKHHRSSAPIPTVNFWSPTPWNVRSIEAGSRLYFMLKHPVRLISGYGVFQSYDTMTVSSAWEKYGPGNGVVSASELRARVEGYASRRAVGHRSDPDPEIGCLELTDAVFLEEESYLDPAEFGVVFPRQIVKYKSFADPDPFEGALDYLNRAPEFKLVQGKAETEEGNRKKREGQPQFRQQVLTMYRGLCCISGTQVASVIQAAHIQPYVSPESNHIQNGLPLRSDLHTLFDAGLISVDERGGVLVSAQLDGTDYESLRGKSLKAPDSMTAAPSRDALGFHRSLIFRAG